MDNERYQKKALECLMVVSKMHDPGERLKLLAIAQQFILLAAHVGARIDRDAGFSELRDGEITPRDAISLGPI